MRGILIKLVFLMSFFVLLFTAEMMSLNLKTFDTSYSVSHTFDSTILVIMCVGLLCKNCIDLLQLCEYCSCVAI